MQIEHTKTQALGRMFDTIRIFGVDDANAFMESNATRYGVLATDNDGFVYLARMDDEGTPINPKPKAVKKPAAKRSEFVPRVPDLASLERDLEKVNSKLRRLGQTDTHLANLSKHFHLGRVGGSGRNTASLNRRREKALDKSIREAGLIVKLHGQRNYLMSTIEKHYPKNAAQESST